MIKLIHKFNPLKQTLIFFLYLSLLSLANHAFAGCSSYIGQASLNEFFKDNSNQSTSNNDFAEVKILNDSITTAVFSDWKIRICEKSDDGKQNSGNGCSNWIPLSDFKDITNGNLVDTTKPWIVNRDGDVGKYINTKTGFDAVLVDASGDLIDYIRVDNYSLAYDSYISGCDLSNLVFSYDAGAPGTSDKSLHRNPDGIGPWGKTTSAADDGTTDTSNDVLPAPPTGETYPYISINNINVSIGGTAKFVVLLSDIDGDPITFSQPITISYYTQDGTAKSADADFTGIPFSSAQTLTIPANQSSSTISISATGSNTADIGKYFYLVLKAVENSADNGGKPNAIISQHFGTATFVGIQSCLADTHPIFAGKELDIEGNVILDYNSTTTTLDESTTASAAVDLSGNVSTQTPILPPLPGIAFVESPDPVLSGTTTLSAGNYDVVTINDNATVTLSAGTYNIDQFDIGDNVTIIFSGKVVINTNEFDVGENSKINDGGDPANLVVNIYNLHDAEFDLDDNATFTGIVYSPFSNAEIDIDDNSTFTGGIFTNGEVELDSGATINYTSGSKQPSSLVLGCSATTTVDHFSINYSAGSTGLGINCKTESVTIAAHDSSHNVVTAYTGSINISTSTGNGDWTKTGTASDANGTLTPGASDSGSAAYTFISSDNGSVILNFKDINVENVNLNVSGNSISETSNSAVANDDYVIDFKASGFIYTIPNQTSCSTSADISIKAVRTDDITKACVSDFQNKDRSLKVWASYSDPAPAAITGSPAVTLVNGKGSYVLPSTEPASANVDVRFESTADETFTITYPDAGQLILKAKYEGSAANSDAGLTLLGSKTFVVSPAKLYVYSDDTNAACASNDGTCSAFKPAGNQTASQFNLKIRAACANNSVTPNFALDNIAISHTNTAPAVEQGIIAVSSFNMVASDKGEHTISTQSVSEVGVFTFKATSPNYLGVTGPLGTSAYIGRFYPHHFDTSVANSCGSFTYSGQPFTVITTAQNDWQATPTITKNYTGSFAYNTTLSNSGNTNYFTNNIIPLADFSNGTATKTDVTYTFANKNTAPLTITLRANNADNGSTAGVTEGTMLIRSGRMRLENAFGSELLPLTIPIRTEYFSDNGTATNDDDGYILNSNDSCTIYNATSAAFSTYTSNLNNGEIAASGSGTVASGIASFTLHKPGDITSGPGNGNDGTVNILFNTNSWLEYNWSADCDGDAANDNDPCATASFGLYRGDDRVIYWREVF